MNRDELGERLVAAGLERVAGDLLRLAEDSIRLVAGDGRSRIGGRPRLPDGQPWPERDGRPLAFVAELDLEELRAPLLPDRGTLAFFYDAEEEPWGFDPKDAGSSSVVYFEGEAGELDPPGALGGELRFAEKLLVPRSEVTLPAPDRELSEQLGLTSEEEDAYYELDLVGGEPVHRVGGWPDQIQGDMRLEAQLVTHGLYVGDASGYEDPRAAELEPGAASWRLLLQIDSDDDAGMMWGDAGRLYWWMTESDLRRRAFSAAWLILQCY